MKLNKGQSLIEILVAMSIFVLGVSAVGFLVLDSMDLSLKFQKNSKAVHLAQEGVEAVRSIRDNSFDALENGAHGIELSDGNWVLTGDVNQVDGYERSVDISNYESGIKKVEVTVEWNLSESPTSSTTLTTLFSNWQQESGGENN